jgi:glycosyltransferase involved in cell wall biosynthesis
MPGEYNSFEKEYVKSLKQKAEELGVTVKWIQNFVGSETEKHEGVKKYCLWDCYFNADVVMYPSLWEGWGNQFIEAIFFKKPVVVLEYPVFKADIKPKGFKVTSLGSKILRNSEGKISLPEDAKQQAAAEIQKIITDKTMYDEIINYNFEIGKSNYDMHVTLKKHLQKMLEL